MNYKQIFNLNRAISRRMFKIPAQEILHKFSTPMFGLKRRGAHMVANRFYVERVIYV